MEMVRATCSVSERGLVSCLWESVGQFSFPLWVAIRLATCGGLDSCSVIAGLTPLAGDPWGVGGWGWWRLGSRGLPRPIFGLSQERVDERHQHHLELQTLATVRNTLTVWKN